MRGLPGSGKSTHAHRLVQEAGQGVVCSADDYFVGTDGVYRWVGKDLAKAHEWNQERARTHMRDGMPLVVVDNVCSMAWEAREYCRAGVFHGYDISFHEVNLPTSDSLTLTEYCDALAQRNVHGCPASSIAVILDRWEDGITVAQCLEARAPWERKSAQE